VSTDPKEIVAFSTYSASMWFFPSVAPHVHHQHILGLEGLLLPGTIFPLAHERLLAITNMVIVEML
jgi:hypothetical protein